MTHEWICLWNIDETGDLSLTIGENSSAPSNNSGSSITSSGIHTLHIHEHNWELRVNKGAFYTEIYSKVQRCLGLESVSNGTPQTLGSAPSPQLYHPIT